MADLSVWRALSYWPALIFWPAIVAGLMVAGLGIIRRRMFLLVGGACLMFPAALYLAAQVMQIYRLGWITERDIRDLLRAVDGMLPPQAHYCSSGKNKKADPRSIAREREYNNFAAKNAGYTTDFAAALGMKLAKKSH